MIVGGWGDGGDGSNFSLRIEYDVTQKYGRTT